MLAGDEIGEKALFRQKFLVGAVLRDAAPVLSAGLLILVFIPKAGPLGWGAPAYLLPSSSSSSISHSSSNSSYHSS